jgi:parvulin-like peptidyl-prolyl isomerase
MNGFLNSFGICLAILVLCASCKTEPRARVPEPGILALVNGTAITQDDLYMRLHNSYEDSSARMREEMLEDIIQEELLYQEGIKLGLDQEAKYRNAVRIMEMKLRDFKRAEMARRVASTRITATVNVTEDDVKAYYSRYEAVIAKDLHLYFLDFPDQKQAEEAFRKIQGGAAFEEIAGGRNPAKSGKERDPWDAGFLRWDQMPGEWTAVIHGMKKGDVKVMAARTGAGAVIKLVDMRTNAEATYDRMSAIIMTRLREERVNEAFDRYMQNLKQNSRIEKNNERRIAS